MKPYMNFPALSMALVASTFCFSFGVAKGFCSRGFSQRSPSSIVARFASSTCLEGASSSWAKTKSTSVLPTDTISDSGDEIETTARSSLSITGPLPPPQTFGGLSYINTTSLADNGAHRVLFILGGPGAGKGTQSERIVDTYKCVHLSVGDLLRQGAEKEGYEHAELVKEYLVQGNIVPVELSLGLLRIAMDEQSQQTDNKFGSRVYLVDGFPRNFDNVAGWMENMPTSAAVLGSLVYNCPIDVLEERIIARSETSGRSDDNLESARRRFQTFKSQTEPVVRVLERIEAIQKEANEHGSLLNVANIDGTGTVEDVWSKTKDAMDSYIQNDVLTANANLLEAVESNDIERLKKYEWYEGPMGIPVSESISNAEVHVLDGVKARVSYDRKTKIGTVMRESRDWVHGPLGWKCLSVSRAI